MTVIGYSLLNATRGFREGGALGAFCVALEAAATGAIGTTSSNPPVPVPAAVLPRVAAGDARAVEQCLDRYGGLVWSLARKYFSKRADAEDAVQEAFVSLWENASKFDAGVAGETTFVAMIARRRMIDLVRKAGAARRTVDPAVAAVGGADSPPPVDQLPERETTTISADGVALRGFEIEEEAARVRLQMTRLSEDQQRVLRLAIGEGQSQTQIAELTGWPLGTVKSHARRGLKRLRELLAEDPDPTSPLPATQEAER